MLEGIWVTFNGKGCAKICCITVSGSTVLSGVKSHRWLSTTNLDTLKSYSWASKGPCTRPRIGPIGNQWSSQKLILCLNWTTQRNPSFIKFRPHKNAFHAREPCEEEVRRKLELWWCRCCKNLANKECSLRQILHAWFMRKDWLLQSASLIPNPPQSFGFVTVSQLKRCTCF